MARAYTFKKIIIIFLISIVVISGITLVASKLLYEHATSDIKSIVEALKKTSICAIESELMLPAPWANDPGENKKDKVLDIEQFNRLLSEIESVVKVDLKLLKKIQIDLDYYAEVNSGKTWESSNPLVDSELIHWDGQRETTFAGIIMFMAESTCKEGYSLQSIYMEQDDEGRYFYRAYLLPNFRQRPSERTMYFTMDIAVIGLGKYEFRDFGIGFLENREVAQ